MIVAGCSSTATRQAVERGGTPGTRSSSPAAPPAAARPGTPTAQPATESTTGSSTDSSTEDGGAPGKSQPPASGPDDKLFPNLGNAGIDVKTYDLDLSFDPADDQLKATVAIELTALTDLTEFSLDADGPTIDKVEIDGAPAKFVQAAPKLKITPAARLSPGDTATVKVAYHMDTAANGVGPGSGPMDVGWYNTPGGAYVLNEPDGTHRYLPSNDHPSDKATWKVTLHVPSGLTGVANGALVSHDTTSTGEVWVWREDAPMATYLLQLLIGKYTIIEDQVPGGPKLVSVVLTEAVDRTKECLSTMAEQITYMQKYFGPYPFDQYGLAITDSFSGLGMETQGRSLLSVDDMVGCPRGPDSLFAHELAHQWFGNAVTPPRWKDIWLNESFATYGQWMWSSRNGSIDSYAGNGLRQGGGGSIGDPTVDQMFSSNTYEGGAAALQALRLTVGDDHFFQILQHWVHDNFGKSATTEDFIALAEKISGTDLTAFFDTWLYSTTVPSTLPNSTPASSSPSAPPSSG